MTTDATACCEPTTFCVCEGDTWTATFTIIDEDGALIPLVGIVSITLDLFRTFDGQSTVINGRDHQNVLNANGGTYYDTLQTSTFNGEDVTYNFRIDFADVDSPFLKDNDNAPVQDEVHIGNVHVVTADGQKLTSVLHITVTNVRRFSVL